MHASFSPLTALCKGKLGTPEFLTSGFRADPIARGRTSSCGFSLAGFLNRNRKPRRGTTGISLLGFLYLVWESHYSIAHGQSKGAANKFWCKTAGDPSATRMVDA